MALITLTSVVVIMLANQSKLNFTFGNFSDRGSPNPRERAQTGQLLEPPPDRPRRLQPSGREAVVRPSQPDQDGKERGGVHQDLDHQSEAGPSRLEPDGLFEIVSSQSDFQHDQRDQPHLRHRYRRQGRALGVLAERRRVKGSG